MLYHFDGVNLGYLPSKFKQMNPKGYNYFTKKRLIQKIEIHNIGYRVGLVKPIWTSNNMSNRKIRDV